MKECNDRKNGYHGFTRKCSGVPLRKCSQVARATATTLQVEEEEKCEEIEDTQCSLVPGQVQGTLEPLPMCSPRDATQFQMLSATPHRARQVQEFMSGHHTMQVCQPYLRHHCTNYDKQICQVIELHPNGT